MRHYCLGGCSAPSVCWRRSRPVRGARAGTWCCVSPVSPISRPACPALRVAGRPVRVSLTLARWYAIPTDLCVPRAQSGCPSGSPRVPFACVCARAPAASAPPPLSVVWRAQLARSELWALVGPFHVVHAPPRVLPRSLALSGVLGRGWSGPGSPLPGCCCEGHLRSGAPPPPTARPLGGLLGSATHVSWARVCGCGGPTLSPWSACPVGAACRGGGVVGGCPRGGVACHCCEGCLMCPSPDRPSPRRAAGAPYPLAVGAGGCGRGDPSPTPQSALLRAGFARCGGGTRAPPGRRLLPGCGASGVGRSPTKECPPSGRAAGAHHPLALCAGGCGRGDPSPTPERALLRAVGAA